MSSSVEENIPNIFCVVCGRALPRLAIYCKECEHYQSPLRRFITGIDISSLTALITSSALALTFVNTHWLAPATRVTVQPTACSKTDFNLAVENTGTQSAILRNLTAHMVYWNDNPDHDVAQVDLAFNVGEGDPIFKPSEERTLHFRPKGDQHFPEPVYDKKACFKITYVAAKFGDADATKETASCECP